MNQKTINNMNAQIAKQQSEINDRVALLNKSAT
jgi:hypothetical protein